MTIRVTVTNADTGDNRIIEVKNTTHNGAALDHDMRTNYANTTQLKGGESADFWVHVTQNIVIREIRNG